MTETVDERMEKERASVDGLRRQLEVLGDVLDEVRDDLRETLLREQAAHADNARLRALIKDRQWSAGYDGTDCPWCDGTSDVAGAPRHNATCTAFTPDGVVR